jgi:phage regulator Rha-like protein
MDNLVFLKTKDLHEEPFTTSEVIAKYGGVKHHALQVLISKHQEDLKEFGLLSFEMRPVEINGTKYEKIYKLNEDQATLLITFMKNTPEVIQFKKNLVRQFRAMVNELNKRAITRAIVKEGRKQLTDVVKEKMPDSKWTYKHLTDLDYKCVLGMNAKQFETKYGIPNGKIRDYIEANQLQQVGIIEAAEKALIEAGYTYHEIKDILSRKFISSKSA